MSDAFPCIICGAVLERATDTNEAQPDDGVMCSTPGNYGSTIFDPMNGQRLAFNICDSCLVRAGEQGRIMTYANMRPVVIAVMGQIGYEDIDRPYIPWHRGLPDFQDECWIEVDDLDHLPSTVHLRFTPEQIKSYLATKGERET